MIFCSHYLFVEFDNNNGGGMLFNRINPFVLMLVAGIIIGAIVIISPKPGKTCFKVGPCSSCYYNESVEYPASYCNATNGQVCVNDIEVARHNALVDLYTCLCNSNEKDKYAAEIQQLQSGLALGGDMCQTMPSKWKERYFKQSVSQ